MKKPDKSLTVACEVCGARAGKPCVNSEGAFKGHVRPQGSHGGRLTAAVDALEEVGRENDRLMASWLLVTCPLCDAVVGENCLLPNGEPHRARQRLAREVAPR